MSDHQSDDVSVLALCKGRNRYIFIYDDSTAKQAIDTMKRFVEDSDLDFSGTDYFVLRNKVISSIGRTPDRW